MDVLTKSQPEVAAREKCVVCGRETPYTEQDNIKDRAYYIDGCGQLCEKCYRSLYRSETVELDAILQSLDGVIHPHTEDEREALVMPYDYAEDEHYYIEQIKAEPKPVYSFVKRAVDIFTSLLALIVLAIPMLIIALAVKLSSPGPILYKQERLGLNGRPFTILKFRSMRQDAERAGAMWSNGDKDDRITPIGRFMRKLRVDELPQLFCTLKGDMTLVGPRPERECFYRAFEEHVHGFGERLKVKPGITGLAQVNGGYDLAPHEKVLWDVEYIKNRSLRMDVGILVKTVKIVLTHDGAK